MVVNIGVDTETGGLDPDLHSILEIALTCVIDGESFEYSSRIAENGMCVQPQALKINGLKPLSGDWDGASPAKVTHDIGVFFDVVQERCGSDIRCVFQNPSFDTGFIKRLYRKADDGTSPPKWLGGYHSIDTYTAGVMAEEFGLIAKSGRLDTLIESVGLSVDSYDRHTALGDARATLDVFERLCALAISV